ncbi:MAG: hypothetical protein ACJLS3_04845 [Erythrobacter sp.]
MLDFFRRRLSGDVPLSEILFNDMLVAGSMINIAIGLCAFAMIAAEWPVWMAVITFLLPQPYNIILLVSVWRSASRSPSRAAGLAKTVAIIWFVIMIIV